MKPCEVKVCRICFAMDCDLELLHENTELYKGYEAVTGLTLTHEQDLPRYLCTSCAEQLMNCARFRHRSLQAHSMLLDILKNHDRISVESVQAAIKTHCDSEVEPVEIEIIFGDVKIENVFDETPVNDNLDDSKMTDGNGLDDGRSGQDKSNTVKSREGTGVMEVCVEGLNQMEGTEIDVKPLQKVTMSCDLCDYGNDNKIQFFTHLKAHAEISLQQCNTIDRRTESNKTKRENVHSGQHSCETCDKSFSTPRGLRNHMRLHDKELSCNICYRLFSQKIDFKNHVMREHSVKSYSCKVCEKSFLSNSELKSHMLMHRSKPHMCDVCKRCFVQKKYLDRHRSVHFDVKPYSCKICESSFVQLSNKSQQEETITREMRKISFARKSELIAHMRLHL